MKPWSPALTPTQLKQLLELMKVDVDLTDRQKMAAEVQTPSKKQNLKTSRRPHEKVRPQTFRFSKYTQRERTNRQTLP